MGKSPASYVIGRDSISAFLPPEARVCKRGFDQVTEFLRVPPQNAGFGLQELRDSPQARTRNAALSQVLPHLCQAWKFVQQHSMPLRIECEALCCVFEKDISKAGRHNADAVALAQLLDMDEPLSIMLETVTAVAYIHAAVDKEVGIPDIRGCPITHSDRNIEMQMLLIKAKA